uniref:Progonadoliberin n=1 Tax=Catharus ustulatus TaxID=91951 RepID=A0A8C3TWG9_CATUS
MAPRGSLLLLALLLLSCALPRGHGQHWSHGWYPGGKRDLRTPTNLQVGLPTLESPPPLPVFVPVPQLPSPPGLCRPFPCPLRREEPLPVSGVGAGGSQGGPRARH